MFSDADPYSGLPDIASMIYHDEGAIEKIRFWADRGGGGLSAAPPLAALAAKSDQGSEWIVRLYPGNRRAGGF
uniref:hypothetical protein n=1 Tax=Angelakisella massiliensis TaxID=1871018 RepID=UPI0024B0B689